MSESSTSFSLEVTGTNTTCPVGETVGEQNMRDGKIPVLSCEGGCIRGEIARIAANLVAKEDPYARGCHGEVLSAPHSAMARWFQAADKVVVIDGCFMRCHGRILENMIDEGKLLQFDALRVYKKYTDLFDVDAVPEAERIEAAQQVADSVLAALMPEE